MRIGTRAPTTALPACSALRAEARRVGWPTHYRGDITTDVAYLRRHHDVAAEGFVWILRELGTFLMPLPLEQRDLHQMRVITRIWPREHARWYLYQRGALRQVTPAEAMGEWEY